MTEVTLGVVYLPSFGSVGVVAHDNDNNGLLEVTRGDSVEYIKKSSEEIVRDQGVRQQALRELGISRLPASVVLSSLQRYTRAIEKAHNAANGLIQDDNYWKRQGILDEHKFCFYARGDFEAVQAGVDNVAQTALDAGVDPSIAIQKIWNNAYQKGVGAVEYWVHMQSHEDASWIDRDIVVLRKLAAHANANVDEGRFEEFRQRAYSASSRHLVAKVDNAIDYYDHQCRRASLWRRVLSTIFPFWVDRAPAPNWNELSGKLESAERYAEQGRPERKAELAEHIAKARKRLADAR